MIRFPSDFSELLSPAGLRVLSGEAFVLPEDSVEPLKPFILLPDMIDAQKAIDCLRILERDFEGDLGTICAQLRPEWITGMTRNFGESLGKTMHVRSVILADPSSPIQQRAERNGLMEMLRSDGLRRFAEAVTGYQLEGGWGSQIICYHHGHYVGPHNDHHPEYQWARDGYVDVQFMFANDAVEHQWFVHEYQGHFSQIWDINVMGAISVFKQPFWHYITPLVGKRGRESEACRWLIGQVFRILNPARSIQVPTSSAIRDSIVSPTSSGCVLEVDTKLSESLLWTWQRNFYLQRGMSTWRQEIVPSNITTNPFIAKAYARVILGFLRDCAGFAPLHSESRMNPVDPDQPIYIFELGSGSGRLGFTFLKQFLSLKRLLQLDGIQIRYVMTDFVEDNLRQWMENPAFRPSLESGDLDLALYDPNQRGKILLRRSGEVISHESLHNPVIVFANYFFDSIEQDLFRVEGGRMKEGLVTLSSKADEEADSTDPDIITRMKVSLRYQTCGTDYYQNPELNRILAYYQQRLGDASFSMPVGALSCIRDFIDLSGGRLLLLSTDKGYSSEEQFATTEEFPIAVHGSISLMVNFQALRLYIENRGGFAMENSQSRPDLRTSAFLLGFSRASLPETAFAFEENFSGFSPYDCYTIVEKFPVEGQVSSVEQVLSLLRLSEWDARLLYRFRAVLREGVRELSSAIKTDLVAGLNQIWENYLPIGEGTDIAFEIGMILQKMEQPANAMSYYERSLHLFGDHFATLHNLGLCYYQLGRLEDALEYFERALTLKPDYGKAREWSSRVRSELTSSGDTGTAGTVGV